MPYGYDAHPPASCHRRHRVTPPLPLLGLRSASSVDPTSTCALDPPPPSLPVLTPRLPNVVPHAAGLKAKRRGQMFSEFLYELGPFPDGEFHRFQRGENIVASAEILLDGDPLTLPGVVSEVRRAPSLPRLPPSRHGSGSVFPGSRSSSPAYAGPRP